ncbi:MAG: chitobiase/beta-hexosaminidase C-terminal domain-containing protein, partial [Bacteroidota bacterium]
MKGYTATPDIDIPAGFYPGQLTVTITNNEPNSIIRYTTDGTNPTPASRLYGTPLTVASTSVIKAQAFSEVDNILPGKMAFATYFIDEPQPTLPVFSVAADDLLELAAGEGELIPIGSLEYFDAEGNLETTSFGSLNRHGQDSWVLDHRSLDWVSRDEMGYSKAVQAPLFNHTDRDEYQKFMFRNSGDDNYPAIDDGLHEGSTHIRDEYVQTLARMGGLKLDTRSVERVIVYLNGQYWGVYGMRDRPVDHDYTDYYYDQGKYDLQYLTTWGTTEVQYGGQKALDDWINLRDFILDNDMSVEENYEKAADSLNMVSLIDYFLVNSNVVAIDWLNYNTGWWRGLNPEGDHKKWGYILWDLDATFDYYINYTGVPNTTPSALVCDIEEVSLQMDTFFNNSIDFPDTIIVADCITVQDPDFPYDPADSVLQIVMQTDPFCCFSDFDEVCQSLYDEIAAGQGPGDDPGLENIPGNIGKHEKIFLKLIEESATFRNLYYGRYADLMNTTFSCEN